MDATSVPATKEVAKGERFNLTKGSGGQLDFYVGLGWNAGENHDLDVVVFGLDQNGKLVSDDYFVYYGLAATQGAPFSSKDGSIRHSGDNLTGDAPGDDEQVRVSLGKLDPRVEELSIVVVIYDAENRRQNFGQVSKAHVQVATMDAAGNPPTVDDGRGGTKVDALVKYPLSDDYSVNTAVQVGSIYRRDDGAWAFNPTGVGFGNTANNEYVGLREILQHYA